jgi:hypothetical protein
MTKEMKQAYLVIGKNKVNLNRIYNQAAFSKRHGITAAGARSFVKAKANEGRFLYISNNNGVGLFCELDAE